MDLYVAYGWGVLSGATGILVIMAAAEWLGVI